MYAALCTALVVSAAAQLPAYMSVDGASHAAAGSSVNAAGARFRARATYYGDGAGAINASRANPRVISNTVLGSPPFAYNAFGVSSLTAALGQFIAHDLIKTSPHSPPELVTFPAPRGDATFDAAGTGNASIPFRRNWYDPSTGSSAANPRRQLNQQTGWLDASTVCDRWLVLPPPVRFPQIPEYPHPQVYGTSAARLVGLRTFFGGLMKSDDVNGLPRNTACLEMAGPYGNACEQRLTGARGMGSVGVRGAGGGGGVG
jgi:hypothetical protein